MGALLNLFPQEPGNATPPGAVAPAGERSPARAAWAHIVTAGRDRMKEHAGRHGGLVNAAMHHKGPSIAEQAEYARNRTWVPPGQERGLLDRAGTRYQRWFGLKIVALGNAVSWVGKRGIHALLAFLVVTSLTVATLWVAFPPDATLIVLAAATTWLVLLLSLLVPSKKEGHRQ